MSVCWCPSMQPCCVMQLTHADAPSSAVWCAPAWRRDTHHIGYGHQQAGSNEFDKPIQAILHLQQSAGQKMRVSWVGTPPLLMCC